MFCAATAGQTFARDSDGHFQATTDLWLPTNGVDVDTPRGSISGEFSVKDTLDRLDFALMGSFEARRNRLGLIADLVHFDLSATQPTPFGGLFDRAAVGGQIPALAAWRVQETDRVALDLGSGARMMWTNVDVTLSGGAVPAETISRNDNWGDPIVVLRARFGFSDKWFGTLNLDTGGFGVSSEETDRAPAGPGYNLNDRWSLLGGWRYPDFRHEKNGNTLDFQQSGIILGAT